MAGPDRRDLPPGADAAISFVSTDATIDLTNCDREPIHMPGSIQPYGVLLALHPDGLVIVQASESTAQHLGLDARSMIGRSLADVLGAPAAESVHQLVATAQARGFGELAVGPLVADGGGFDATVHWSGDLLILELEPTHARERLLPDRISTAMRSTVRRLENAESLSELAQGMAAEMRDVTGFDRVWVYRFHADWHGEIIGESRRDDIDSWIGLHYPASDIPAQARALFLRNWVRVIPDLHFAPSALVSADATDSGEPLDLGGSLLRSVSPIHVQYLQNMGVTASLVISLIHRGRLWGLISGHHYGGPKRVSYSVRSLCEFLAQALSLQIGAVDRLEQRDYALQVRSAQSRLIDALGADESIAVSLAQSGDALLRVVSADGAVIIRHGDTTRVGDTPRDEDVALLVSWLRARTEEVYVSDHLAADFPAASDMAAHASGVLAMRLSHDRRDFIMWFRRERQQTIRWAGDPRKPVTTAADGSARLHPRGSFALWEEEARGTSLPWLPIEVDAARDIRRALLDVLIRKSEEIAQLNEELYVTNAQLTDSATELEVQAAQLLRQRSERESLLVSERAARSDAERANRAKADFLAVMSHELRTPLNAIGGYAQLMTLGVRGEVTTAQLLDLERIRVNQRHLLGLINSILNFTKLEAGQFQFVVAPVPIAALVDGMEALIGPQLRAKNISLTFTPCSPDVMVMADDEKVRQVLLNLLTNALKFTAVGGSVHIGCVASRTQVQVIVRDNGRGIAARDMASIFEPFVQVDRHVTPQHEQGVGLGLAISRELARGMNGDLTAESTPGTGSAFTLTLPTVPTPQPGG